MAYTNGSVVILDKASQAAVKTVFLKSNTITFGAHPMNSFRVHTDAERLHCKIVIAPKTNGATIVNFSKQNPVLVNGVPLARKTSLQSNDVFEVAGSLFRWNFDPAQQAGEARKNAKQKDRKTALLRRVRSTDDFPTAKRASVCNDVPRSVNLFLEAIRKRRTIHSAAFDVDEIVRNGLATDDEVLEEADITHDGTDGVEMIFNTPPRPVPDPLNTPVVEQENMATPRTVDYTPKSKLVMNVSKVFIVSYSPSTPAKELRHGHCKAPPSTTKRTPLRSKNCSFATPGKFDNSINVSMPEHNMHLIDLTTPTESPNIARTPKSKPRILSSFNLVTPSPKKVSQTPTLTKNATPSATKTLLKSALKNASSVSKGSASKAAVTPQRKQFSSIRSISSRGTPAKLMVPQMNEVSSDESMPNLANLSVEVIRKRRTTHSAAIDVDKIVRDGLAKDGEELMEAGSSTQDGTDGNELGLNTRPRPVPDCLNTPDVEREKMATPGTVDLTPKSQLPMNRSMLLSFSYKHATPAKHNRQADSAKIEKSTNVCKRSASKTVATPQRKNLSSLKSISARTIVASKSPGEENFTVQQMNEMVSDDITNLPFIAGIVNEDGPLQEVPYLKTHPTAVFNVEEIIKTPNRTTQVRSAKYSDVTPHESFVDGGSGQTVTVSIDEDSTSPPKHCKMNMLERLSYCKEQGTPERRRKTFAIVSKVLRESHGPAELHEAEPGQGTPERRRKTFTVESKVLRESHGPAELHEAEMVLTPGEAADIISGLSQSVDEDIAGPAELHEAETVLTPGESTNIESGLSQSLDEDIVITEAEDDCLKDDDALISTDSEEVVEDVPNSPTSEAVTNVLEQQNSSKEQGTPRRGRTIIAVESKVLRESHGPAELHEAEPVLTPGEAADIISGLSQSVDEDIAGPAELHKAEMVLTPGGSIDIEGGLSQSVEEEIALNEAEDDCLKDDDALISTDSEEVVEDVPNSPTSEAVTNLLKQQDSFIQQDTPEQRRSTFAVESKVLCESHGPAEKNHEAETPGESTDIEGGISPSVDEAIVFNEAEDCPEGDGVLNSTGSQQVVEEVSNSPTSEALANLMEPVNTCMEEGTLERERLTIAVESKVLRESHGPAELHEAEPVLTPGESTDIEGGLSQSVDEDIVLNEAEDDCLKDDDALICTDSEEVVEEVSNSPTSEAVTNVLEQQNSSKEQGTPRRGRTIIAVESKVLRESHGPAELHEAEPGQGTPERRRKTFTVESKVLRESHGPAELHEAETVLTPGEAADIISGLSQSVDEDIAGPAELHKAEMVLPPGGSTDIEGGLSQSVDEEIALNEAEDDCLKDDDALICTDSEEVVEEVSNSPTSEAVTNVLEQQNSSKEQGTPRRGRTIIAVESKVLRESHGPAELHEAEPVLTPGESTDIEGGLSQSVDEDIVLNEAEDDCLKDDDALISTDSEEVVEDVPNSPTSEAVTNLLKQQDSFIQQDTPEQRRSTFAVESKVLCESHGPAEKNHEAETPGESTDVESGLSQSLDEDIVLNEAEDDCLKDDDALICTDSEEVVEEVSNSPTSEAVTNVLEQQNSSKEQGTPRRGRTIIAVESKVLRESHGPAELHEAEPVLTPGESTDIEGGLSQSVDEDIVLNEAEDDCLKDDDVLISTDSEEVVEDVPNSPTSEAVTNLLKQQDSFIQQDTPEQRRSTFAVESKVLCESHGPAEMNHEAETPGESTDIEGGISPSVDEAIVLNEAEDCPEGDGVLNSTGSQQVVEEVSNSPTSEALANLMEPVNTCMEEGTLERERLTIAVESKVLRESHGPAELHEAEPVLTPGESTDIEGGLSQSVDEDIVLNEAEDDCLKDDDVLISTDSEEVVEEVSNSPTSEAVTNVLEQQNSSKEQGTPRRGRTIIAVESKVLRESHGPAELHEAEPVLTPGEAADIISGLSQSVDEDIAGPAELHKAEMVLTPGGSIDIEGGLSQSVEEEIALDEAEDDCLKDDDALICTDSEEVVEEVSNSPTSEAVTNVLEQQNSSKEQGTPRRGRTIIAVESKVLRESHGPAELHEAEPVLTPGEAADIISGLSQSVDKDIAGPAELHKAEMVLPPGGSTDIEGGLSQSVEEEIALNEAEDDCLKDDVPNTSTSEAVTNILECSVSKEQGSPEQLAIAVESGVVQNDFKIPVTPAPKRRLFSKNAFNMKTPEEKSPSPLKKISSQEYFNILEKMTNETHLEKNHKVDVTYSSGQQQQSVERRVLPSRASRQKVKTLCEDELAGASPEIKFCKPKLLPEMSPLLPDNDDTSVQDSDRRRVIFQEEVSVKEFNSPNIVGDIIKKVTGRGRRGRVMEASSENITLSDNLQDVNPADADQTIKPKRLPRKLTTKTKGAESDALAEDPTKETKGRRAAKTKIDLNPTPPEAVHITEDAQPAEELAECSEQPSRTTSNRIKKTIESTEPAITPVKQTRRKREAKKENELDHPTSSEAAHTINNSESGQPEEKIRQEEISKKPRKTTTKKRKEMIESTEPSITPIKQTRGKRVAKQNDALEPVLDTCSVSEAVKTSEEDAIAEEVISKRPRKTRAKQVDASDSATLVSTPLKATRARKTAKKNAQLVGTELDESLIPSTAELTATQVKDVPVVKDLDVSSVRNSPEKPTTKAPLKATRIRKTARKNAQVGGTELDESLIPPTTELTATQDDDVLDVKDQGVATTKTTKRRKQVEIAAEEKPTLEESVSDDPQMKKKRGRPVGSGKTAKKNAQVVGTELDESLIPPTAELTATQVKDVPDVKDLDVSSVRNSPEKPTTKAPLKATRTRKTARKNAQVDGTDMVESLIPPPTVELTATQDDDVLDVKDQGVATTKTTKRRKQVEIAAEEKLTLEESVSDDPQIKKKRGRPVGSGKTAKKNAQVVGTELDESLIPPTAELTATQVKDVPDVKDLDVSSVRNSPEKPTTKTTKRRKQVEIAAEEKPTLEESVSDDPQMKKKRGRPVASGKAKK